MDIGKRLVEHYEETNTLFKESQIVGLFCQGSQNYGLDYEGSDLDTKLIVVPTFKDICLNKKPVSTTHVRANNEHIDLKDVRLYMDTFKKQNLNFLEILFTDYYILNPLHEEQWRRLMNKREEIARMNPYRCVKSMKGIALEKYHAMEHKYPSKMDIIEKHGYDGKQVSHLIRVEDFLRRYINGEDFKSCLHPTASKRQLIMDYKKQLIPLEVAREEAARYLESTVEISEAFCDCHKNEEDAAIRELLEDVSYNIMKNFVEKSLR